MDEVGNSPLSKPSIESQIKRLEDRIELKRQAYTTAVKAVSNANRNALLKELLDRLTVVAPTGEQAIWILGTVQHIVGALRGPMDVIEDYERDVKLLESLQKQI